MPISNGEQLGAPGMIPPQDDRATEKTGVEQLAEQVELAKKRVLEVATTEGPETETAIEVLKTYFDVLQVLADTRGADRDNWLATESYVTYLDATKINPSWQIWVDSAREEIEMMQ